MKCYKCKKAVDDSVSQCPKCGTLLTFTSELIQRAIQHDQAAIEQLYNMTNDNVYYSIKTMLKNEDVVMDLMQDTYVKAFSSLSQLKEPATFRGWIKRIAHNKTVDYLRKAKPVMFSEIPKEELAELLEDTTERYSEFLAGDHTIDVKDGDHDYTFWRDHIGEISDNKVLEKGYFAYKTDPGGYEENILFIPCKITVEDVNFTNDRGEAATETFEDLICVYKLRNIYMEEDGSIVYDESYVEQTCFYNSTALLKDMEFEQLEYAYDIEEVQLK